MIFPAFETSCKLRIVRQMLLIYNDQFPALRLPPYTETNGFDVISPFYFIYFPHLICGGGGGYESVLHSF